MTDAISLLLFVFILNCSSVFCLIPRPCASNFSIQPSVCCPTPVGFSNPCGYPSRGICQPIQIYKSVLHERDYFFMSTDIRFRWPLRLYSHSCLCNGNYWGPDCGQCQFGFKGPNCTQRYRLKRKNAMLYTKKEKRLFVDVLVKSRTLRSEYVVPHMYANELRWHPPFIEVDPYEFINFVHTVASAPDITTNFTRCNILDKRIWDYAHLDIGFLPYHRYLIMWYERVLGEVAREYFGVDDFSLPYWDWTNLRECDVCTDDMIGSQTNEFDPDLEAYYISNRSAFGNISLWPIYCQKGHGAINLCEPCQYNRSHVTRMTRAWSSFDLPTVEEVIETFELPQYRPTGHGCSSLLHVLEDAVNCTCQWKDTNFILHAKVHLYLNGTFKPLASAIFDPMFLLHHAQIDRIYEGWLRGNKPSIKDFTNFEKKANHCSECFIASFFPTVRYKDMFVDSRRIGYDYDNFNFGPLHNADKLSHWSNTYENKTCPKRIVEVV